MAAQQKISDLPEPDKLTEKQMADRLGTTVKALQARRSRGQIPNGIWNKIGNHIIYSVRRYDEWLESLWVSPPGLISGGDIPFQVQLEREALLRNAHVSPHESRDPGCHPF